MANKAYKPSKQVVFLLLVFALSAGSNNAFSLCHNSKRRQINSAVGRQRRQPLRASRPTEKPPLFPDVIGDNKSDTISVGAWEKRRLDLLELFQTNVYGRVPNTPYRTSSHETIETTEALQGRATLRNVRISIESEKGDFSWCVQFLTPNNRKRQTNKLPVILLICNTCRPGPRVDPLEPSPFWPTDEIIEAGFATAAFYNGDVDPDDGKDDFRNGIHEILDDDSSPRPDDAWGAVAAWSWAASRFVDYLQSSMPMIDATKTVVVGHSRGGKTALWAAANDERFAMAVSNNSGCTGASLSRHRVAGAETIDRINKGFPHWFCRNYRRFSNNEDDLPVDQHMLLGLIAPRAVYVASATNDFWADPVGEYLATCDAAKVWSTVYGMRDDGTMEEGFDPLRMPTPDKPILSQRLGYHTRTGEHDLCIFDWLQYIGMAKRLLLVG